jgi:hypothetical protein
MIFLEMQLPTSFFDSQIHLNSHLVEEVAIGSPFSYRWMFPIEWYLKTLKGFVKHNS